MKVAITGATGFLGRHVAVEMAGAGHQVRAWRNPAGPAPETLTAGIEPRSAAIDWVAGRLGDEDAAAALVHGVDAVVHAAVYRGGPDFMTVEIDPAEYYRINVLGSLRLLQAAAAAGVRRFVFISSGAVHQRVVPGRPIDETHPLWPASLYGAGKAAVETLIHCYGAAGEIEACSLRPTSIYGLDDPPSRSRWHGLVRQIASGSGPVDASGGAKSVHVEDLAAATRCLAETDADVAGETFLCVDRMISDFEVAEIARRLSGSAVEIRGPAKVSRNEIDTTKLRSLGVTFGGGERLEATVRAMLR